MKRTCCILIAVGIIMTMLVAVIYQELYLTVIFGLPYIIAGVGLPHCVKKNFMIPMTTLLSAVTLYNILYLLLKVLLEIDLYNVEWHVPVQYVIPLIIGYVLQYAKSNTE